MHEPARAHGVAGPRRPRADAAPGAGRRRRRDGHRTFLLADEPGLGKTAQALLAAEAANAYPLLVVVPNVVKTNWAREAAIWTPKHPVTVIHGDGHDRRLRRHRGRQLRGARPARRLGDFGFRGMVVDEAHFIKNKSSQRSRHALELSERIRARTVRPLLMALTGTPLINDIEDFRAIWQFLGWIDDKKPLGELMDALEDTGLTPADFGFYPPPATPWSTSASCVAARSTWPRTSRPQGRRPSRRARRRGRPFDPGGGARLARRMVERYETALERRTSGPVVDGIDHELVRRVATWEREDTATAKTDENVFSMMRRIGQAKAGLAADYTAQLARSVGKVVFFAKHIDVMDVAEETFAKRGIRYSSIRGDQTSAARQRNIDAFVNDPEVSVIVCSLSAAGVGLNLQVASNTVLAGSPGPRRSRPRPSTASTGSVRRSPSRPGASSRRRPSTRRSRS